MVLACNFYISFSKLFYYFMIDVILSSIQCIYISYVMYAIEASTHFSIFASFMYFLLTTSIFEVMITCTPSWGLLCSGSKRGFLVVVIAS